jgi:hypothetical protein
MSTAQVAMPIPVYVHNAQGNSNEIHFDLTEAAPATQSRRHGR